MISFDAGHRPVLSDNNYRVVADLRKNDGIQGYSKEENLLKVLTISVILSLKYLIHNKIDVLYKDS